MNYVDESHSEITVEIRQLKMAQLCLFFLTRKAIISFKKCPSPTNANKGQLSEKAMALKVVNVKTSIHVTIILQKGT